LKLPISLKRSAGSSRPVRTVFISKYTLPLTVEEAVDVVLSPAYYWFREEVLPAKNAAQAKKLAPAFFDAIIPEGEYEYLAIPRGERFWLFAYDPALISERLSDAGLKASQIRAVYFAQLECEGLETALEIDERHVLAVVEGVVSVLPARYAPAEQKVGEFCASKPRSRHKVSVSLFRSGWLDEKQLGRLIALAVVFLALYVGNYLQLRHQYRQQLVREYTLKEHYGLPETSFQLKSLVRSLESRQKRQLRLRRAFKQMITLPLRKGEAMLSMLVGEKKADLTIALAEPKRAEAIKAALQKHLRVTSARVKNKTFYVSVAYE